MHLGQRHRRPLGGSWCSVFFSWMVLKNPVGSHGSCCFLWREERRVQRARGPLRWRRCSGIGTRRDWNPSGVKPDSKIRCLDGPLSWTGSEKSTANLVGTERALRGRRMCQDDTVIAVIRVRPPSLGGNSIFNGRRPENAAETRSESCAKTRGWGSSGCVDRHARGWLHNLLWQSTRRSVERIGPITDWCHVGGTDAWRR